MEREVKVCLVLSLIFTILLHFKFSIYKINQVESVLPMIVTGR